MKLLNREYCPLNIAAWYYFVISAIFVLSLIFAPFVGYQNLKWPIIIVGLIVALVLTSLGIWLKRISLKKAKYTFIAFHCGLLIFTLFAIVGSSLTAGIIFGIPLIFIVLGMRQIEIKEEKDVFN